MLQIPLSGMERIEIHCPLKSTPLQKARAETLWRDKFEYNRSVVALIYFDAKDGEVTTKGAVFESTRQEFRRIFTEE